MLEQQNVNPQDSASNQTDKDFFMEKENRKMVTPYAFSVDPLLLGWPLATPAQRLKAMSIDLIIVCMTLLVLPIPMQLIIAGAVLWKLSNNKRLRSFPRRRITQDSGKIKFVAVMIWLFSIPEFSALSWDWLEKNEKLIEVEITEGASFFSLGMIYFVLLPLMYQGQTIGKKMVGIQVIRLDKKTLCVWEMIERYGGYAAGVATGMMGFIQIYWDYNRQAIQDKIAHTLVVKCKKH